MLFELEFISLVEYIGRKMALICFKGLLLLFNHKKSCDVMAS